ncbi:MAG: glycoside hydrolase family 43 protein [Muribaculaceae bacterium]|nr:glycoside hydrolase family 43 protein [Muribaculaceae bacterium]
MYKPLLTFLAAASIAIAALTGCSKKAEIVPGAVWTDTEGQQINAHGGGVLYHDGLYYWYGENRPQKGFTSEAGVNVYSSPDLTTWTPLGLALTVSDEPGSDIESGCIIERPKVIYNPKTGKFVMWFHLELKGQGYGPARAAVAVADRPEGPFTFVKSGRVNPGIYPENMPEEVRNSGVTIENLEWWTPRWYEAVDSGAIALRDIEGGQMARDQTVFVDDDGKAYHIYSSEDNLTLNVAELNDEYTGHTGKYVRIFPAGHNEAPAIFKHNGKYWMIASGCTGWAPNEARLMTAENIYGPWEQLPNPCVGPDAELTFKGQSNYILPVEGQPGKFIAMFDRWNPENLFDSRYVWLPIDFKEDGTPYVEWRDSWILD